VDAIIAFSGEATAVQRDQAVAILLARKGSSMPHSRTSSGECRQSDDVRPQVPATGPDCGSCHGRI